MAQTVQGLRDMAAESLAWNTRLVGHHDLNGHGDGMQVIKVGQYVYVAHVGTSPMALTILHCADPASPRLVRQIPHVPNTHNHKVQIVGNTLIQNSESISYLPRTGPEPPVTGINIYNLDDPTDPRQVAFFPTPGSGVHRMWYHEYPYAHVASAWGEERARGYLIVDLSDQTNPTFAGHWHVPGTYQSDPDPWPKIDPQGHYQVHGVIPHRDRAYASCTDAGMAVLDISDLSNPRTISHINWHPPYGGYSHTSLPLPGRGLVVEVCEWVGGGREGNGDKRIWLIDVRDDRQPVIISSLPLPKPPKGAPWESFFDLGDRFGPHNVHENRPGSLKSETRIYSTWFAGGMRITDISDADRPEEVGYFVWPTPPGELAPMANDLFVDENGLIYITDRKSGGLYVVEYTGG